MDLSLSIAIGSSVQVALFVAPVLVLASLVLGPAPMDLAFPTGLVLIVLLSVLITGPGGGRRTLRLAQGRAAACRLPGPGHHLLLRAGRGLALMIRQPLAAEHLRPGGAGPPLVPGPRWRTGSCSGTCQGK